MTGVGCWMLAQSLTKTIVDWHLPELVFEYANLPILLLFQNVVHKSGLACAKKSGHDLKQLRYHLGTSARGMEKTVDAKC